MKKIKFIWILCLVLFLSCQPKATIYDLFETDRDFSLAASDQGFDKAFIEYAHKDAILLRTNSLPIEGKAAIIKLFEKARVEGIQFSWEPINGEIAKSGDMGFTYGIYTLKNDSTTKQGTYVSVWKKNKNGEWKYILDSGNEGLK